MMRLKMAVIGVVAVVVFDASAAFAFHGSQISGAGTVSMQADPYSGSANFAVPLDVPPGRGGIQPNIPLRYNSNSPDGILGVGWSLEFGAIQRSTKKGVPSYTDSDTFVLAQNGGAQELVYDASAGFYRAKQEGAFMKIQKVGNYWVVTDQKGIRYHFGETLAAQEHDPNDTSHIFKWCLSGIEDLFGNKMTITYWANGGRSYPQYIDYTGNAQAGFSSFARVEFQWGSRLDPTISYANGYISQILYRLERVDAFVEGVLQYRFVLNYHQSNTTGRSLIDSITQYGADASANLPPLTFQYQESAPAYTMTPITIADGQFFSDFNGDGRMDRGIYASGSTEIKVALSNGSSFENPSIWLSGIGAGLKLLAGNFDGDGITDICIFTPASGHWDVFSSNGKNQFVIKGAWISGFGTDKQPGSGDFNGDGLTDIAYFYDAPDGTFRAAIALNAGDHFAAVPEAAPIINSSNATGITGDFNGDGLTDFGVWNGSSGFWSFRLNPGNIKAAFPAMIDFTNFGAGKAPIITDFNSDGLLDIGYYDNGSGKAVYRLSDGYSFGADQSIALGWSQSEIQTADFNGDGLPDFAAGTQAIYASGTFPDLLRVSSNGIGGATTIGYAPSTIYDNTLLPFPLQVVKTAAQSNSLGDFYTTQYSYADGFWNGTEREFYGFGSIRVTDPEGSYVDTQFLQDAIFKGRIAEQRTYDIAGTLYSKTVHTWNSEDVTAASKFIHLKRKDNFIYDGDSTGRRTAEEIFYGETPQYGHPTKVVQFGEVDFATGADIGNDSRSAETEYVNNDTLWLMGLPRLTTVKNHAGQIVRKVWLNYDNHANTESPVYGLLTQKESWAGDGQGVVNPVTRYAYDSVGNIVSTTDAQNHTATVTYDSRYRLFPIAAQNALGHSVKNEYYGVEAVPLDSGDGFSGLWGQLKATTDPNDQTGKRVYDTFGRLVKAVSPLDSLSYPSATTLIEYLSGHAKVTTSQRIRHGKPQTIDAVSFYDGLGRLIQTKTPTEVAGRFTVSGQAEYDSRGLKSRSYLPYFTTNPLDVMDTIDFARPHTTTNYDAMGRPVKTINADSTYVTVVYEDWITAAIDENGHQQASNFDAYGRLIEKREYLGADGRSSYYPAKPYTLYAKTLYSYDSEGNLVQTTDAYGNATTIFYDNLGRKTAMDDPDMGQWQYGYDLNGNLTRQTDAKGQTINFTYDILNRLVKKSDAGSLNVDYTYDDPFVTNSKGRLTRAAYAGGNTQFTYDELGREIKSVKAVDNPTYEVNRAYDALNNLLQVQYPDQGNVFYQYNAAGQIEMIANGQFDDPVSPGWVFLQSPFTHFKLNDNAGTKTVLDTGTGVNSAVASVNTDTLSTAGHINSAFQFNGTDQYVNADGLLADIINDNTGSFTMWVKPEKSGVLLSFAGPGGYLSMEWSEGRQSAVFSMSGISTPLSCTTATGSLPSGVYAHVAFVQDGIGLKIYINGVEQPLSYWAVANKGAWFHFNWAGPIINGRIGAYNLTNDPFNNIGFFQGGMDDLRYYKKALTASEVSAIYNKGLGTEDSMVSYTLSMVDAQEGLPTGTTMLAQAVSPASKEEGGFWDAFLSSVGEWLERNLLGVGEAEAQAALPDSFKQESSSNGLVSIETENYHVNVTPVGTVSLWEKVTTTGQSGTASMKANPNRGVTNDTTYTTASPRLDYKIKFVKTGTHYIWIRGIGASGTDDSLHAGLDGQALTTSDKIAGFTTSWTWSKTTMDSGALATINVTAVGEHTLNLWMREDGIVIDKIVVTVSSTYTPSGTGPAQSPQMVPAAPVLNIATPGNAQVSLSWSAVTGASGYKVYYGKASWTYNSPIDVGSAKTRIINNLTNGTKYYFAVVAYNAAGQGVYSNELSATPVAVPAAPVLNTVTAGDKQVTLSWAAAAGAAGYKVYYGTSPTVYGTPINVSNTTTSTLISLTNGTAYYFAVSAYNTSGESVRSNEKSATPVAPPPTVTLTASPATITAGESAALTWSSTNAGSCTASGGWTGSKTIAGTANVTPSLTTVYTLTCTGPGGSASAGAEVTVNPLVVQETPTLYVKNVDYNAAGQMTKVEYGNGDVTTYTYNSLNLRLTRLYTVDKNGVALQDLNYTYDSVGNILSIDDKVNTAGQTFKYDDLNRLTEAAGQGYGTKTYVYDEIGNIVQKDGKTYFYGDGVAAGPHAVTALSDGTAFSYDANGNMVTKTEGSGTAAVTMNYTYDAENRLVKVVKNGSVIGQYEYDGDGGRTKKTATVSRTTTTTTFVGSLFETSGARNTKFIFLGGQRVAAVTNSPSLGSSVLYYHSDHLGGANVLTDATGFKKELIEYEPFGQESRHEKYGSSEEIAWYYFTGKPKDDETGLYYFGARYYDPKLGRFIQPDTIVPYPSDPQSFNRYTYARNNPVNVIDPTGHKWSWKKFWNGFAGAVVGAIVTVATGGLGAPIAFALGGMVGGAITGGLEGGVNGALMGGLMGGVLGGAVGAGVSAWGAGFGYAALAAGGGYAIGTGHADSFVGGLAGGYVGSSLANGYLSATNDYLAENSPTEGIRANFSAQENENWAFLGAGTTEAKARAFANENQMSVIYTKSRGTLADLFRAGFKKVGVKGPYIKQTANYLSMAEDKFILAHSEGAENLAAGIKVIAADGTKFNNLEIKWIGPAISRTNAANLSTAIRAQSSYSMNWADPVGAVSTFNPVQMSIYGGLGLATGTIFHGTDHYVR